MITKEDIKHLADLSRMEISEKETDFVVVGENPGSKLSDAQKLGVKILTEEQFLKL